MKENKEQILMKRLLIKEEAAWKELFGIYSGSLAGVCSRYIAEKDDVRDVLQNSFIKMFRSIETFEYRGEGSLKAWMMKIAVNEALKFIRDNSGFQTITGNFDFPETADDEDPDFEEIPQAEVMKMIQMLPEGYRTVFNLYVFEKKSHKEIAELLGIAENSSASQFHRAKGILIRKIKEFKMSKKAQYE